MSADPVREWLEALEADDAPPHVPLAYLAAQEIELPEGEVRGALRRAVFLLAAGGDPQRALDLDAPAVVRLARDLDAPGRRTELEAALARMHPHAAGLARVTAALADLRADGDAAWLTLAAALLAAELAEP